MRRILPLLAGAFPLALGSRSSFSVHDDILAFPQYDVIFSDTFILDTDASAHLASSFPSETSTPSSDLSHLDSFSDGSPKAAEATILSYELLRLHNRPYLCAIPVASPAPLENITSAASAATAKEAELREASIKGWALLKEMEGVCLFYISGYWSYSFCYGREVRQFHQLPPGKDIPLFPPVEDQSAPAFILGTVEDDETPSTDVGRPLPAGSEVQVKGETRYLRQKLSGGSECDLTGKGRKIEVQFHCHPSTPDKIGYIKEVTTCSYLMIIYTTRLCSDKAFLPPKEDRANPIACREVIKEEGVAEWKGRTANEAAKRLGGPVEAEGVEPQPHRTIVGGIEVGAMQYVGTEGKRLELATQKPAEGKIEVVATSAPKADGGKFQRLTDKELLARDIDPKVIEELRRELDELYQGGGWKLEVVETETGDREIRGVPDVDDSAGKQEPEQKENGESQQEEEGVTQGSEEELQEEL
jgi:protein OS-9